MSDQRLMHYSDHEIQLDRSRTYEQHQPYTFRKPVGFWLSVEGEDDWPSWCQDDGFGLNRLAYAHHVTLADDANRRLLRITTPLGIDSFHATYAVEGDFERSHPDLCKRDSWPIDWRRVTADYSGIIIAPYQHSRRFSPDWYYGWDCASGCIWDLSAIASVTALSTVEAT